MNSYSYKNQSTGLYHAEVDRYYTENITRYSKHSYKTEACHSFIKSIEGSGTT